MSRRLTCSRGHQWLDSAPEGSTGAPPTCPRCGATVVQETRVPLLTDTRPALPSQGRPTNTLTESGGQPAPGEVRAALPPRRVLAGHEILAELGRGGMGVVYKARHLRLNRLVALKMILAGARAGPEELARFRHEAESVARVHHPGIVQISVVPSFTVVPHGP